MQSLLLRSLFNCGKGVSLSGVSNSGKAIVYGPLVQLKLTYTSSNGLDTSTTPLKQQPFIPLVAKLYSTETEKRADELDLSQLAHKAENIIKQRQVNPFSLYVKENIRNVVQQNPNSKVTSIYSMMASQWRSMTFEQKLTYLDKANENREANKRELNDLYANLSKDKIKEVQKKIKENRSIRRKKLSKMRTKRQQNKLKKPKRPPSGFILYAQSLDRGEANMTEFTKGAAFKWKSLAQEDKDKFLNESKKLQEEYKMQLRTWESKMLAEGHEKLVRKSFKNEVNKNLNKKKTIMTNARMVKAENQIKKKLQLLQRQVKTLKNAKLNVSKKKRTTIK